MVVAIPLRGYGNRYVAYVDDEDLASVVGLPWKAVRRRKTIYAQRCKQVAGKVTRVYMHRQIMNAKPDEFIDHKDHRGFNNQRSNLRPCTQSQNQANTRPGRYQPQSGYRGVRLHNSKWRAIVYVKRKPQYLGMFDTPEQAARAFDEAARTLYGDFASLNFPCNE